MTTVASGSSSLDRAIDDYLTYLRVERGVADATMRAYRGDLVDFAMSRGAAARWASGPEVAQQYLAARARRGRPNEPGLAPRACAAGSPRSAGSTVSRTGTA